MPEKRSALNLHRLPLKRNYVCFILITLFSLIAYFNQIILNASALFYVAIE